MDRKSQNENQKTRRFWKLKRLTVFLLAAAVLFSGIGSMPETVSAASRGMIENGKAANKKMAGYSVSKKAGTYSSAIKVKIKAKKGYKVYYTTSGKFQAKKVISSGKTKTISMKKTTTLFVYAVKKSVKVNAKKLKKITKQKKYVKYRYVIKKKKKDETSTSEKTESSETVATEATEEKSSETAATEEKASEAASEKTENSEAVATEATEEKSSETAATEEKASEAASEKTENSEAKASETAATEAAATEKSAEETAAQSKIDEAAASILVEVPETVAVAPAVIEPDTPQIAVSSDGVTYTNAGTGVTCTEENGFRTLTIAEAGTYVISGGTKAEPLKNFVIAVKEGITDEVNLIWDSLVIDNSAMGVTAEETVPVFSVGASVKQVNITLKGASVLTGNGSYTGKPTAIISAGDTANILTFTAYEGDDTAGLTVVDAMDAAADFGSEDPADGIYSKGTLVLNGGNIQVTSNGECLKGTGKSGKGGIFINGGTYTLRSNLGGALKSKNGMIVVTAGEIQS
ncbi:MAG: hypothetical protein NC392_15305, partial [Roseburia sp.]|nr:hypothetical protein [Roseburia sp.]